MPSLNICISEKCGFILEDNMCVWQKERGWGERRVERGKRAILKGREGCKEQYIGRHGKRDRDRAQRDRGKRDRAQRDRKTGIERGGV